MIKKRYWLKGAIIGFIIALINHIIIILFDDSEFFLFQLLVGLLGAGLSTFCDIFKIPAGESCGMAYLFWLPIILTVVGLIIGMIFDSELTWRRGV